MNPGIKLSRDPEAWESSSIIFVVIRVVRWKAVLCLGGAHAEVFAEERGHIRVDEEINFVRACVENRCVYGVRRGRGHLSTELLR